MRRRHSVDPESATKTAIKNGGREGSTTVYICKTRAVDLDDVDFGWQVARYFKTDFGFANGWLGPDLHEFFLQKSV